jgi:hypothetical protein
MVAPVAATGWRWTKQRDASRVARPFRGLPFLIQGLPFDARGVAGSCDGTPAWPLRQNNSLPAAGCDCERRRVLCVNSKPVVPLLLLWRKPGHASMLHVCFRNRAQVAAIWAQESGRSL